MKRTIWKYTLKPECTITMPTMAKILTVHEQYDQVCLWAEVNPDATIKEDRQFRVYGTGHEIPFGNTIYLGSVYLHGGQLVFHVYELKSSSI